METIKNLIDDIEEFSLAHAKNKRFYYQLPADYNTNFKIYPSIFCNWVGGNIDGNIITNKFTVLILELASKDQSDLIYCQSNRNEVAKDLINYLFNTKDYNLINIDIEPLTEVYDDFLTGVELTFDIQDNYIYYCEQPLK